MWAGGSSLKALSAIIPTVPTMVRIAANALVSYYKTTGIVLQRHKAVPHARSIFVVGLKPPNPVIIILCPAKPLKVHDK
jgi:hypothetical protein